MIDRNYLIGFCFLLVVAIFVFLFFRPVQVAPLACHHGTGSYSPGLKVRLEVPSNPTAKVRHSCLVEIKRIGLFTVVTTRWEDDENPKEKK